MRYATLLSVATTAFTTCIHAELVDFFYTETVDLCQYDNVAIPATNQTENGGVCAWRQDVERVYGCPAPDPTCWTYGYTCPDSTVGQTVCNRNGATWCCNAVAGETCTTATNQINVCISDFKSPNAGVSVDQAQEVYLDVLGVSNVTATAQSAKPTFFSVRTVGGTAATASATGSPASSSSSPASASSTSNTLTSTAAKTSGTGSSATDSSALGSSDVKATSSALSGGAIAGIVVGAIVVIALIVGAFFFGKRRSKQSKRNSHGYDPAPSRTSDNMTQHGGAYYADEQKKNLYGNHYGSSEMGVSEPPRVEMPGNPTSPKSATMRPQELA